jgi:hypothetical protein
MAARPATTSSSTPGAVSAESVSELNQVALNIPGVVQVELNGCSGSGVEASVENLGSGAVGFWTSGSYTTNGSFGFGTATSEIQSYQFGEGSGAGAKAGTLTVSIAFSASQCVVQATAQVTTTTS